MIDFHTHLWLAEHLHPETAAFIRSISPAVAEHADRLREPAYAADVLRAQGVDHAVVLPEHCPETSGNLRTETVLEYCAAEPAFFLPFASVHPRLDPDPPDLLRRYIGAGVRGLKLYPSYQFYYADDPLCYPLYAVCADAGIPVLLHVGSSVLPGTRVEFSDPAHLDPVARGFPDLAIVMAHGGRGHWYDRCARLVAAHDNVYIDISGLVPSRLLEHFPRLDEMAERVVFGSDWPAMPKSVAHNAAAVRALGLPPAATDRILEGNARALLRLVDGEAAGS